jgi:diadenosine tetraphosphate (Ap4A) HIT family hydrolase
MAEKVCFVCDKHARGSASPGFIHEDGHVYASHILPPDLTDVYLGYLMIEPKRHVAGLGELTDEEAAGLGVLGNKLARALRASEGAEHVYSFVIGHEVSHLHIHLTPRYPGTPTEYWGSRIGQWPDAPRGDVQDITAVCDRLRQALSKA